MARIAIASINHGMAWMYLFSLSLFVTITMSSALVQIFVAILGFDSSRASMTLLGLLIAYSFFIILFMKVLSPPIFPETIPTASRASGNFQAKQLVNRNLLILFLIFSGLIFLLVYFVQLFYDVVISFFETTQVDVKDQLLTPTSNDALYFFFLGIQVLILGPMVEESIYRIVPLVILASASGNKEKRRSFFLRVKTGRLPLVISALTFSFAHLPGDLMTNNFSYVFSHQLYLFTLGMILGISFLVSRNVFLPMVLHSFNNAISYIIAVISTSFPEINISSDLFLVLGILTILLGAASWYFISVGESRHLHSLDTLSLPREKPCERSSDQVGFSFIWILQLILFGPGMGFSTFLMASVNLVLTLLGIFLFVVLFLVCLVIAVRYAGTITV